jgi:hypothetical protein
VKVLHDCPDATVDICFIHGLTGNRESTWTADGQSTPWPKTLLPPKLNNARILTYGYDAYIVRKGVAGLNRLIDHAANLLHDLTTDRSSSNASSRPLIFVAHSLGSLVCKKAILLSRNNPEAHLCGILMDHLRIFEFSSDCRYAAAGGKNTNRYQHYDYNSAAIPHSTLNSGFGPGLKCALLHSQPCKDCDKWPTRFRINLVRACEICATDMCVSAQDVEGIGRVMALTTSKDLGGVHAGGWASWY